MNCPAIHRLATLLLLVTPACAQSGPRADLVAIGRVWTGDSARPWAEAVAVQGDTIVRDARGDPTGVLKDKAMTLVSVVVPDPSAAQADSAVARATR